ncbi:MAG: protein kinase [Acidobacteria bacterium]|nr:protein kinase [Acidobacteriota bacterium]
MIGKIVGNYKILEDLGEGGVGMVYKGVDTMLDREVAIKVMRPELASQTSVVERFRSEAITLAKLNHPNIATLFSLFREGDELYMVLEFVEGETLEDLLHRRGSLSPAEALPIFCQALDGINYAHELGIVHRDIKPSNMMLGKDGKLKVLDFGIARLLGTARMTRVGNIIGTLEYMSPEQVRGEETDERSDIYGLGMMLYEVLTGQLPFQSENEFALMKAHTEEMPAPPRQLNPDISAELEEAIMKAVAKDPAERFQNGGEFLDAIFEMDPDSVSSAFGSQSIFQRKIQSKTSDKAFNKVHSKDFPVNVSEPQTSDRDSVDTVSIGATDHQNALGDTSEVPNLLQSNIVTEEISAAQLAGAEEPSGKKPEIKETRLGVKPAPVTDPALIKQTRLASGGTGEAHAEGQAPMNAPAGSGFFQKLTWIHYAGAGIAVIVLFGLLGIAAAIPFLLNGEDPKPAEVTNSRPEEPKEKIESKPEPTRQSEIIVSEGTPTPEPLQPIEEVTPEETASEKRTPSTRNTPKPAPTVRKPAPTPKPTRKPVGNSKEDLRGELTGKKPTVKKTPNLSDN